MASEPGFFIALEGIDGSGTSTQARALAARVRGLGRRVLETCEPSRGPIGRLIREHLSAARAPLDAGALALLFAADRLDHLRREIEPALAEGVVVISDRYVLSSLVYQSTECDPEWVVTLNQAARWPDLCVLVDLPVADALARVDRREAAGGSEKERYDHPEVQERLAAGYRAASVHPRLGPTVIVDGAAPIEGVTEALLELCLARGLGG